MEVGVVVLLLCAAIPAGQQGRWPWDTSLRPPEEKVFEKVVAQGKGQSALSHLLRPPFGRSVARGQVLLFLRSRSLTDGGYAVIDEAVRREALLEKAREAYRPPKQRTNAATACGSGGFGKGVSRNNEANPFRDKTELAYHSLKARLRLALAFGKAAVAGRMASPETASYSSQAMESAIDSMRNAARELEQVEKRIRPRAGQVTSRQLWDFHRSLLDVWEKSKNQDNVGLIRDLDLRTEGERILESAGR